MLFAIDAAQKLGEQGENTQVGSMGDAVLKRTATRRPCLRPGVCLGELTSNPFGTRMRGYN